MLSVAMTHVMRWWRAQSPTRQDRYALLFPLAAVVLFLLAMLASFAYLRYEETSRDQEAVQRDVEYAQQRIQIRLLERQEQLMRLAADAGSRRYDSEDFVTEAEGLVREFPELQSVVWLDAKQRVRVSYASPSVIGDRLKLAGEEIKDPQTNWLFLLLRNQRQPQYGAPVIAASGQAAQSTAVFRLFIPMSDGAFLSGALMAEFSAEVLLQQAVPTDIASRYALAFTDAQGKLLAGAPAIERRSAPSWLPWRDKQATHKTVIAPVGEQLIIRAQAYRTSAGLIGSALFWLVLLLSGMTAWLLVNSWRHTQTRLRAQSALLQETNFRRAMENSMVTGMRALDLDGRITYVNPAFCQMTGWTEADLLGLTAPFPYWPDEDREALSRRLDDELSGSTTPAGFQVRVKRRDGSLFDARMYVSPLIDGKGQQTGWMTSMTDITEPNRVRRQLSESYERFTTVLEGLDASVSVAPLGGDDLLFANKMYRQWFGTGAGQHLSLLVLAAQSEGLAMGDDFSDSTLGDTVDALAGLPAEEIASAKSENAEVFLPRLGKWLEVRSRYLNWTDGRLAQMVIATDITPRRNAEELAAQQAEKAQAASRLVTMGEMASSVAHELNQPLTAISNYCNGMISRLQAKQMSEQDMLNALEKTSRQAQRAGQIIQRIRSFVKRSVPNRALSDVSLIVSEALELAEIELRRRNVRLTRRVAASLPRVVVDPILIEQVLVNLLKNAAEAIDHAQQARDRRAVDLQVSTRHLVGVGEVVEFVVTDTGQGLAPEVMDRLFEAFFSTKPEGMGIGLNLCRSIVEGHQGRMQAENLYNGPAVSGCRFSFWLPCLSTDAAGV